MHLYFLPQKRTQFQSCHFACALLSVSCRQSGLHTQLHLAKSPLTYLQLFTHTQKKEKEKNQKEHLSNVDLKEELEKLTSQAHFSSLALSRNKQFS